MTQPTHHLALLEKVVLYRVTLELNRLDGHGLPPVDAYKKLEQQRCEAFHQKHSHNLDSPR
jgi:hypothetical protein